MTLPRAATSREAAWLPKPRVDGGPPRLAVRQGSKPQDDDEDEDDEDGALALKRPGALSTGFAKLPNPTPYLRNRSIGPHLTPDFSYEFGERTTLGLITDTTRLDGRTNSSVLPVTIARPTAAATAATQRASGAPSVGTRVRDLGLGVTLDYRFGH